VVRCAVSDPAVNDHDDILFERRHLPAGTAAVVRKIKASLPRTVHYKVKVEPLT